MKLHHGLVILGVAMVLTAVGCYVISEFAGGVGLAVIYSRWQELNQNGVIDAGKAVSVVGLKATEDWAATAEYLVADFVRGTREMSRFLCGMLALHGAIVIAVGCAVGVKARSGTRATSHDTA